MVDYQSLPSDAATPGDLLERTKVPVAIADYLRDGWRLFADKPIPHIAYTAVMLVVLMVLNWVPVLGQLIATVLLAPLMAALYLALARQQAGRIITANDYLEVLNDPLPLVLLSLVMSILVTIGFFLLVLPGIYLLVAYLFAVPMVLFQRFDFWTAMETSRKFITRQWLSFFVLAIVLTVINMAGAALFGIGLLVTIPLTSAVVIAAYGHQIGLAQPSLPIE